MDYTSHIILPQQSSAFKTLHHLSTTSRAVCFSGLPAVGKSLYIQQFSYLAMSSGREITTLQWDRARQSFETEEFLTKYPEIDGVTHPAIRKACGLWARRAVHEWNLQNGDSKALLIIEAPLVGNRLVELAAQGVDECEIFLRGSDVQFVIPVPTREVRTVLEAKRKFTAGKPQHEQEKADANPFVVALLSRELSDVAIKLGYRGPAEWHHYNPELYEYVFRKVLKYRNMQVLTIDFLVDAPVSVYALSGLHQQYLVPGIKDATDSLNLVASRFSSPESLQASVDEWYSIDQSL